MAVPHAQAKQMLEETKRREEEAIKRQAQAAKHFEVGLLARRPPRLGLRKLLLYSIVSLYLKCHATQSSTHSIYRPLFSMRKI